MLKAFEIRIGIKAEDTIIDHMRLHVADAVFGLCCTMSDSLAYALEHGEGLPENRYPLTTEHGGFRGDMLPALAIRMHCLPEDLEHFGTALGQDFSNFLREHGGSYTIVSGVELRLHDDIAYIYGATTERHRNHYEPLEEKARVVKLTLKKRP